MIRRLLLGLALSLLLMACQTEDPSNPATPSAETGQSAAFLPTATPESGAEETSADAASAEAAIPTATVEPTPVTPSLALSQNRITDDGILTFDEVALPDGGWLVVTDAEENVLGHASVPAGANTDFSVEIDPFAVSSGLTATLPADAGEAGTFEFPGADTPLDNVNATLRFGLTLDLPEPLISLEEQTVGTDGLLLVQRVYLQEPGWLVIHADDEGEFGDIIGQLPLAEGLHEELTVPIQWRQATPDLHAVLYEDAEVPGGFDPDEDLPVLAGGSAVTADVIVTLPPDLMVFDQPVVNGSISIERALSSTTGWLVAYTDNEGQPGFIIGYEPLEPGMNENIEMALVEDAVTPQLFFHIHEDLDPVGEFDFPASDPVTLEGRLEGPFFMRTNPGNYIITRDQVLSAESEVTVPLVITDLDVWVVVYTDADGALGEIIGQTWLPAGVNRDTAVVIDADSATDTLYAVLHQDVDEPEQFDFPDGLDTPLQRNRNVIQAPFHLTEE